HGDERYGPFDPVGGPVPLHRYRKHRKSRRDVRQDRVAELATRISIPRSALSGEPDLIAREPHRAMLATRPFDGPDRFEELAFATPRKARAAIAEELRVPLGKLSADDLQFIADLLARTLVRAEVMVAIRERFPPGRAHAG
ncbi:IS481 family transposase, partial [Campylobacter coli]|nr:IS481 family transposase [Campylobacter coli]